MQRHRLHFQSVLSVRVFAALRTALVITAFMLSGCTRYLFYPLKPYVYTPDIVGLEYSDIGTVTADGLKLHGWKLQSSTDRLGSLIFFHGNAENISTHFANVYWLAERGYDVYLFDYRGYGKSEGVPRLDAIAADFDVMLDVVIRQLPADEKLIVMGHSFGASLSIYGVAHSRFRDRIAALVSVAAFSDYQEVTQEVLSRSWLTWALQWPVSRTMDNSYRPLDSVALVSPIPLLIMHATDDEVVDFHHAQALYATARPPKELLTVNGDHNHIFSNEGSRELLFGYLRGL